MIQNPMILKQGGSDGFYAKIDSNVIPNNFKNKNDGKTIHVYGTAIWAYKTTSKYDMIMYQDKARQCYSNSSISGIPSETKAITITETEDSLTLSIAGCNTISLVEAYFVKV